MKRTWFVCLVVSLPAACLLAGCALRGQASAPAVLFQGNWVLDKTFGVTAPANFTTRMEAARDQLTVRSHWDDPQDDRYALTLMGITMNEFVIATTGREQSAQVGPFVFKHSTNWENGNLVTRWSTSEFMGSSFQGAWTRAVSKDGGTLTLDIDATSSTGKNSRARLIFHRPSTTAPAGNGSRARPVASNIA
jgi:hypothetical protein